MKTGKRILLVLVALAGLALSVSWIMKDPGFNALFRRTILWIGFIPLPGQLMGFVIQLIPAIGGAGIAISQWDHC